MDDYQLPSTSGVNVRRDADLQENIPSNNLPTISKSVYKLSDVIKELNGKKNNVALECTTANVIFIDCDLLNKFWHGRSVTIKIKKIVIVKHITWDLSGKPGKSYTKDENEASDDKDNYGHYGKNGENGENSGSIYFNDVEEIVNYDKWTIKLNGGIGGNGQNGSDGFLVNKEINNSTMHWEEFEKDYVLKDNNHKRIKEIVRNICKKFDFENEFWNTNESCKNPLDIVFDYKTAFYLKKSRNESKETIIVSFHVRSKTETKSESVNTALAIAYPIYNCYVLYKCNRDIERCPGKGGNGGQGGACGICEHSLDIKLNIENNKGCEGLCGEKGKYFKSDNNLDFGYIFKGKKGKIDVFGKLEKKYLDIHPCQKSEISIKCPYREHKKEQNSLITICDIIELTTKVDKSKIENIIPTKSNKKMLCEAMENLTISTQFYKPCNTNKNIPDFKSKLYNFKCLYYKDLMTIQKSTKRSITKTDMQLIKKNTIEDLDKFQKNFLEHCNKLNNCLNENFSTKFKSMLLDPLPITHNWKPEINELQNFYTGIETNFIKADEQNTYIKNFIKYFLSEKNSKDQDVFLKQNFGYIINISRINNSFEDIDSEYKKNTEICYVFFKNRNYFKEDHVIIDIKTINKNNFKFESYRIENLQDDYILSLIKIFKNIKKENLIIKFMTKEKLISKFHISIVKKIEKIIDTKTQLKDKEKKETLSKIVMQLIIFNDILNLIEKTLKSMSSNFQKLRDNQLVAIYNAVFSSENTFYQFPSGEGKSIVIACASIMRHLFYDENVHVISSTHVLAERDAEQLKQLYNVLGINVEYNCEDQKNDGSVAYEENDVVYGSLKKFQYDYLRYSFKETNFKVHIKKTVFVDEVDHVLLDNGNNMLYLSTNISQFNRLETIFILIWNLSQKYDEKKTCEYIKIALYRKISLASLKIISQNPESVQNQYKLLQDSHLIDLNDNIITNKTGQLQDLNNPGLEHIFENLPNIPECLVDFVILHLKAWANSAQIAKVLEENCDYVIDYHYTREKQDKYRNIIIISKDTGTYQIGAEWDEALHQFLQLKHNLTTSTFKLKYLYVSNLSFINQYAQSFGFTGTLGSNYSIFKKVLKAKLVTFTSFQMSLFIETDPVICDNDEQWKQEILKISKYFVLSKSRPILILCETIKDVNSLNNFLKDRLVCELHVIEKDLSSKCKTNKIENKCVILSTNLSSRGSDIRISDDLNKNGGLHVCLSYLPENERIEKQAYSRTARNGQFGTGSLCFRRSSLETKKNYRTNLYDQIMDLKFVRNIASEEKLKNIELIYTNKIIIQEKYLKNFKDIRKNLLKDESLIDFFKSSSIYEEYLLNEWALFLDKKSFTFEGEKNLEGDMIEFQNDLSIKINNIIAGKCTENNFNLVFFIKCALENIKIKKFDTAHKILDFIIQKEPNFSAAAHYYKAYIYAINTNWKEDEFYLSNTFKSYVEELQNTIILLRKDIDYNLKTIESKNDKNSEFCNQKLKIIQLYMILEITIRELLNSVDYRFLENWTELENLDLLTNIIYENDFGTLCYSIVSFDWKQKLEGCPYKNRISKILEKHDNTLNMSKSLKISLIESKSIKELDCDNVLANNGFIKIIFFDHQDINFASILSFLSLHKGIIWTYSIKAIKFIFSTSKEYFTPLEKGYDLYIKYKEFVEKEIEKRFGEKGLINKLCKTKNKNKVQQTLDEILKKYMQENCIKLLDFEKNYKEFNKEIIVHLKNQKFNEKKANILQ